MTENATSHIQETLLLCGLLLIALRSLAATDFPVYGWNANSADEERLVEDFYNGILELSILQRESLSSLLGT